MVDVVDKETRSRMMAGIQGRNTRPEVELRKALHRLGYRYRLHGPKLPGRPDIVLPRHCAVIFVNGCFWYRHEDCRFATTPATNPDFWASKFAGTVERDRRNLDALRNTGWRTAVIWECVLRSHGGPAVADIVHQWLQLESQSLEWPTPLHLRSHDAPV